MQNLGLKSSEAAERVEEALGVTGLSGARDKHPYVLSRGQRQMLAVASIIALRPEILVIDEPTAGLDRLGIQKLMALVQQLNQSGTTIIMISHDLELVQTYASRVIVLRKGRIWRDCRIQDLALPDEMRYAENESEENSCEEHSREESEYTQEKHRGRFWQGLDVRTKMLLFLIAAVSAYLFKGLIYNLTLTALIGGLALAAGARPQRIIRALLPLLPVFLLIVLVDALRCGSSLAGANSDVIFYVLPSHTLALTKGGIESGLNFLWRIFMMVFATVFLTTTTPVEEFVRLLHKWRVPPVAAFTLTTALRFIPALDQKRRQILDAQKARGAKFEGKGLVWPFKAYIPLMVPLLIYSIVLANSLAMAMLNRGFGFTRKVTQSQTLRFNAWDFAISAMGVALFSAELYLRLALHGGA
ncbi:P-loop containing nucleoside triphosphate hydrolase [Acididesulfobacillus acetoxydans]|uniref:ABC-type cobalt transport system, permease component CbiQ n=1 Tax=Acididesulfobacillus acetoxydans TaxID=1561005 RepID=A0A8S0WNK8_9FIRM|nr:CbiQ family ECF transporter T component [Acididesulfobacillus acetoxydans]CAA7601384.1 P-loop containing nucleoside triphosphate hydrolase [Acididesulfobacillus acetoxydans]CEJ07455.1 ABC-type cobalt transport system, permease component CbiQ [Acididesulfobacillus acetoxydans]